MPEDQQAVEQELTPALEELDRFYMMERDRLQHEVGNSYVIVKAQEDPFDYACRLTSGEFIRFESMEVSAGGEYCMLKGIREMPRGLPPCPRGLEVRRDAIIWMADAPEGS